MPSDEELGNSPHLSEPGDGEWKDLSGPQTLYRITSTNKGTFYPNGDEREEGAKDNQHWFTEDQFASFIDPETEKFSQERFRAWGAVREDWQSNFAGADGGKNVFTGDETMLRINSYEMKAGESLRVRQDYIKEQDVGIRGQDGKYEVLKTGAGYPLQSIGHGRQTYLENKPDINRINQVAVGSDDAKKITEGVVKRQPSEYIGTTRRPDQGKSHDDPGASPDRNKDHPSVEVTNNEDKVVSIHGDRRARDKASAELKSELGKNDTADQSEQRAKQAAADRIKNQKRAQISDLKAKLQARKDQIASNRSARQRSEPSR